MLTENGSPVFDHLEELRSNIHYIDLKVPAGRHEVMLKTTQTRNNNGQFSLQITGQKSPTLIKPGIPRFALKGENPGKVDQSTGLAALMDERQNDMASMVRALLWVKDRDQGAALELLEALFEKNPRSQLIGGLLARILS